MSISHPTPGPRVSTSEEPAGGDLRPLAAFLDLALPLDRTCAIIDLTPAPADSAGDLLAAVDRAIASEVRAGWLVPSGVDEDGVPTFDIRREGGVA